MKLIRKSTEPNEFPDRAGKKLILAQRFGNVYSLKFIRYLINRIQSWTYSLTADEFNELVRFHGRLLDHKVYFDEYFIVPKRNYSTTWIARFRQSTNVVLVHPNNAEQWIETADIRPIQKLATSKVEWYPVWDQHKNRWIVTNFPVYTKSTQQLLN
jgi:hypothetical protein